MDILAQPSHHLGEETEAREGTLAFSWPLSGLKLNQRYNLDFLTPYYLQVCLMSGVRLVTPQGDS